MLSRSALLTLTTIFVVAVAVLQRLLTGLHPYSGKGKAPMFGDFEAQRHWIELTNANSSVLPPQQWYVHNPVVGNDLQYWGLDYPPLTAYHSYFIGKVTHWALQLVVAGKLPILVTDPENPVPPTVESEKATLLWDSVFRLESSRGSEGPLTIIVMRLSSLVSDLWIFFPAVVLFAKEVATIATAPAEEGDTTRGISGKELRHWYCFGAVLGLELVLLACPLVLIDHGHFQYNAVSLGLIVWFVYFSTLPGSLEGIFRHSVGVPANVRKAHFRRGQGRALYQGLALIAYFASVYYKQMSLYYLPAVGIFFLAQALTTAVAERNKLVKLISFVYMCVFYLALVLVVTLLVFLPLADLSQRYHPDSPFLGLEHVLSRMFPFKRGLYEDKVASVWCAVSPVFKLAKSVSRMIFAERFGPDSPEVRAAMVKICAATTLFASLPSAISYLRYILATQQLPMAVKEASNPEIHRLKQLHGVKLLLRTLTCSALSFFLFSFQVHEKSILLPWLPASLHCCVAAVQYLSHTRLSGEESEASAKRCSNYAKEVCSMLHLSLVALFSMYPLVIKDGLYMVYFGFFFALMGSSHLAAVYLLDTDNKKHADTSGSGTIAMLFLSSCSMIALHIVDFFWTPPAKYPDIVTLGFASLSCLHFVLYWLGGSLECYVEAVGAEEVYAAAWANVAKKEVANQKEDKKEEKKKEVQNVQKDDKKKNPTAGGGRKKESKKNK